MKLSEFNEQYGDYEIKDVEELKSMLGLKGRWRPDKGEYYYIINQCNNISSVLWDDHQLDNFYYDLNRVYKTKEECKRYLEIHKSFKKASVKPNWKDNSAKYYLAYNYNEGCINILDSFYYYRGIMIYYFDNGETLKNLIKQFGEDDIKKYVLGVYD